MFDTSCPLLPDMASWRFDEIERCEPERARALSKAGSPNELLIALRDALCRAIDSDDLRAGLEHAKDQPDDRRAVVQFGVGSQLFDWFINGRTGYRAHFRSHYACGLGFNEQIIKALRDCLDARLHEPVDGRKLNSDFDDCGPLEIQRASIINSLVPHLSKIWFCTKRICKGDGIEPPLPPGVPGPRILLGECASWAAPYQEDDNAWLDVKGAFIGEAGPYQPKDPIERAETLHTCGEA